MGRSVTIAKTDAKNNTPKTVEVILVTNNSGTSTELMLKDFSNSELDAMCQRCQKCELDTFSEAELLKGRILGSRIPDIFEENSGHFSLRLILF